MIDQDLERRKKQNRFLKLKIANPAIGVYKPTQEVIKISSVHLVIQQQVNKYANGSLKRSF